MLTEPDQRQDGGTLLRRTFGAHPPGLWFLCLTQMWERFSFYGMRVLLVLYLTSHLLQPENAAAVAGYSTLKRALEAVFGPLSIQAMSSQIYGMYVGLVYLTPLLGGLLADRWLGQRRSVFLGGTLIATGHFLMVFEQSFLFALLFIVAGSGCFTSNISALVGKLYPPGDSRRDKAFSLFYVGIQIGSFFAPLVCGLVGEMIGWHYGFALAGIGMLIGLATFAAGRRYLPADSPFAAAAPPPAAASGTRGVMVALAILVLLGMLFWAAFEQVGNVLNLWVLNETDRTIGGFEIKTTSLQALNPLLIMILTPPLMALWTWLGARGKEPSTMSKMIAGCSLLALGYVLLTIAAATMPDGGRASLLWTLGFIFLLTMGELLFSPTSWALFSRLGPPRLASSMMGIWYLSLFGGGYLAGYLGTYWERVPRESFWLLIAAVAAAGAVGILLVRARLRKPLATPHAPEPAEAASL